MTTDKKPDITPTNAIDEARIRLTTLAMRLADTEARKISLLPLFSRIEQSLDDAADRCADLYALLATINQHNTMLGAESYRARRALAALVYHLGKHDPETQETSLTIPASSLGEVPPNAVLRVDDRTGGVIVFTIGKPSPVEVQP